MSHVGVAAAMSKLTTSEVVLLHLLNLIDEAVDVDRLFEVNYESPLTIDLGGEDEEDEPVEIKKKKRKKNVFYGIKTKKGFTRTGFGDDVVIELFYYLKVYEAPDPYVRDIYWYDFKKRKIANSRKINEKYAGILHGPYLKMLGVGLTEKLSECEITFESPGTQAAVSLTSSHDHVTPYSLSWLEAAPQYMAAVAAGVTPAHLHFFSWDHRFFSTTES